MSSDPSKGPPTDGRVHNKRFESYREETTAANQKKNRKSIHKRHFRKLIALLTCTHLLDGADLKGDSTTLQSLSKKTYNNNGSETSAGSAMTSNSVIHNSYVERPPTPPTPDERYLQSKLQYQQKATDQQQQLDQGRVILLDKPVPPLPEGESADDERYRTDYNYALEKDIESGNHEIIDYDPTTTLYPPQHTEWLLRPLTKEFEGRKCLVLDLDETLVHSSFKYIHQADFVIPVEIESQFHNVYVIKRPGVDEFMKRVGELFEIVVFTASVSKYGDPLLDQLDMHKVVHHRLFRESCFNHQGNYIKNLSQLGRPLQDVIIIDNSPASYIFHPQHAIPVSSWFSDAHDNELLDMIPFLEDLATDRVPDVSLVLDVNIS